MPNLVTVYIDRKYTIICGLTFSLMRRVGISGPPSSADVSSVFAYRGSNPESQHYGCCAFANYAISILGGLILKT